jgi:hypothetical protein
MGFILKSSKQLLLVIEYEGFSVDGFCVVRKRDALRVDQQSKAVRFFQHMMRMEGLERVADSIATVIDIESVATTLRSLQRANELVILSTNEAAVLGEIVVMERGVVLMRPLSELATWEPEVQVRLTDINQVVFASEYLRQFHKRAT